MLGIGSYVRGGGVRTGEFKDGYNASGHLRGSEGNLGQWGGLLWKVWWGGGGGGGGARERVSVSTNYECDRKK